MVTVGLSESASVRLDGSGNGVAKIGPHGHSETWSPNVASVSTSTAIANPVCNIFNGSSATPDNFCDATYTENQDSTDRVAGKDLVKGQFIWAVWTNGDPGAIAVLAVTGTKELT